MFQASLEAVIGKHMPRASAATVNTRPTTTSFQPERFHLRWIRPKNTANRTNSREIVPAAPLEAAVSARTVGSAEEKALKVPATISAKAAMTRSVNSQQNSRNSLRPKRPMYFSMMRPMDLPSFFTLAYSAPKSVTAPKKMPPSSSHSSTGSQPKAAA